MKLFKIGIIAFIFIGQLGFAGFVWASNTNGTIDPTDKYAWTENVGWLNFGSAEGNVYITDLALTGYVWGENIGWIVFSSDYKVKTDWRPRSVRPACNNTIDDDGDGKTDYPADPGCSSLEDTSEIDPASGGGLSPEAYSPPTPPAENFSILINNNEKYTASQTVSLVLDGGLDAKKMAISNFSDFKYAGQEGYIQNKTWDLCEGFAVCLEGLHTVYVKFYTQWGQPSEVVSDSIIYQKEAGEEPVSQLPPIEVSPPTEKPKKPFIEKVPKILKPLIPDFLAPKPPEIKPPEIPIEDLLPKSVPLVFQAKWQLLPSKPIQEFVLAPLPSEIRKLAQKFPEFGETLKKVGITKITDVEKLKTVKLTLPGLTEKVGLPTGIPVAKLSLQQKQQIPTEIVFAKTGGQLIDFNAILTISDKGEPEQKITTISGKLLQLVVKPDKPVRSIKGYVVFKSKTPQQTSFQIPFSQLVASIIFANPVFAKQQEKPVRVEEKLVLQEFKYTDPDGDGIYTAEIQTPLVDGEYEIITVMNFEDPELGAKEIRLTTVVDPEGYIYEKSGNKETRIPGAII